MTARLSDDTLATALICGGLVARSNSAEPLSLAKWNDLARRLFRAGWWPRDLLRWGVAAAREPLALDDELASRLDDLLAQAVPVAAEIERLLAAGIRVLSRADEEEYPSRWRSRTPTPRPL